MIETFESFRFSNPLHPFFLFTVFFVLMVFFWYFTKGIRQFLAKKNYITLLVIQVFLFGGMLFIISEPTWETVEREKQVQRLLVLFDGSQSTLLRAENPWRLIYEKENPIQDNAKDFEIEYYLFGEELRKLDPQKVFLPKVGDGTKLLESISKVLQFSSDNENRKVLVFSDGQDQSLKNELDLVSTYGVPIFTVGLGENYQEEEGRLDLKLDRLDVPDRVPVNQKVLIRAALQLRGKSDQKVWVDLFIDGERIARKSIQLIPGKKNYPIKFYWTPVKAGKSNVLIKSEKLKGENDQWNNVISKKVLILEGRKSILFVIEKPSWEVGHLIDFIKSYSDYSVDQIVIVGADKIISNQQRLSLDLNVDQLRKYGALVLAYPSNNLFSKENIKNIEHFVAKDGGGLILLADTDIKEIFEGDSFGDLRRMVPFNWLGGEWGDYLDGGLLLSDNDEKEPIKNLQIKPSDEPKIKHQARIWPATPKNDGQSVMVFQSDDHRLSTLMGYIKYGLGNVLMGPCQNTWMIQKSGKEGKKFYKEFWSKTISLSMGEIEEKKDPYHISLHTPNSIHQVRNVLPLIVKGGDAIKGETKQLRLSVRSRLKDEMVIPLVEVSGSDSEWRGQFIPTSPGEYTFFVNFEGDDGKKVSDQLVLSVRQDDSEYDDLSLNGSYLKTISSGSKGEYLTWDEYLGAPYQFKKEEKFSDKVKHRPFWASPIVYLLMIVMMSGGWILRRSIHLD